jgi:hypothetical protein
MFELDEVVGDPGLCAPFVALLPVTGASISVISGARKQSTISTSDATAAEIDELQFELGEGPHWDALRTGAAVYVPDFKGNGQASWPILAAALGGRDPGALFSFPLRLGAVTIGVADLYSSTVGDLSSSDRNTASSLAGAVAEPALAFAIALADADSPVATGLAPELRREVHQATGMILVQLDIDATEAFLRLRGHAFSSGKTIQAIARDVVQRRLNFRDIGREAQ